MLDDYGVTGARTHVELTVDVPPDRMWDLVTDVSRMGAYSPECEYAAWLGDDAGPRVGARFEARNRFPHGLVTQVVCVVTAAERPRMFEWAVLDGGEPERPFATWGYDLAPGGSPGSTLVRQSFVHGPGNSGLRAAVRANPGQAESILDGRLAELRRNMIKTLEAMVAS